MSTVAHHHEEDRRHHQTAPLNAFSPSVLVTAAATANTPNLNPSSASSSGAKNGSHAAKGSANATPMVRHHTATEDVHQRSPLRAFEPTNAAGTSASHDNTPLRSRSPVAGNLRLSFAGGIDANDLPTVGSSASENVAVGGVSSSSNNNGGSGASAGDITAQRDGALHSSSSNYPMYDYESMNDVSDHPKHQVKPLHNAKSPRGSVASHH